MAKSVGSEKTFHCSFCGKTQHEVRKLIVGPTVYICDECIELCAGIIAETPEKASFNAILELGELGRKFRRLIGGEVKSNLKAEDLISKYGV